MGAAPIWDGQPAVVPPLRNPKPYTDITEIVPAKTPKPGPRRYFARIPTHAIGVASERRRYPRAALSLPLRLVRVEGRPDFAAVLLVTRNISSSGIFFLAPREIAIGTGIELQVALVERPSGLGSVQMYTAAHIVRTEECDMPGWRGYAASFDDFALQRDDIVPA
ncbi:MAG TPA: PilZ domain-containing protein [Candidatus Aquilonibacter sp.]|nr:PilZ domain-containing protein [Candidatus Aquilonibacter sp.]